MQKLPSTVQTDSRKLVEDLSDFLGTIVRGWRLIAVCVGITLALAVIYLARVKPVYLASARLLVLQHGGQPLTVANGASNHDNLFQSVDGYSNSLTTHIMIIRSPLIVGRSLAAAGLKDVSAGSVIAGLSVKLPDPAARVLELSYGAHCYAGEPAQTGPARQDFGSTAQVLTRRPRRRTGRRSPVCSQLSGYKPCACDGWESPSLSIAIFRQEILSFPAGFRSTYES